MADGAAQQVDGRAGSGVTRETFTADEGLALLGGADPSALLAARAAAPKTASSPAVAALTGAGQWLFVDEPRRWLLEVLRTKLRTFAGLLGEVEARHGAGRPQPGAGDGALGFVLDGEASAAPVRWRLRPLVFEPTTATASSAMGHVDRRRLGLRLVQWLLVDDEQPLAVVADAFARCAQRLDAEQAAGPVDASVRVARARQQLGSRELRARCEPLHLLHRRVDRDRVAAAIAAEGNLLDAGLWQRVLVLGLRLLAADPQFGSAGTPDGPEPLAAVFAELAAIERRLHVALFASTERDRLLEVVCSARHEALTGAAGGGDAPLSGGCQLTVKKGEAVVQQVQFAQDRVTIGRREGENLLRLNDAMVSSAHAILERTPEGWCVMDRNSTNGTEVDGIRLPGEVPQPLQDGSQIQIRPFTIVFQSAAPGTDVTTLGPAAGADELWEQLQDAFAAAAPEASAREQALQAVLAHAETRLGPMRLAQQLDALGGQWRRANDGTSGDAGGLASASMRALDQLSRALVGTGDFRSPADVQGFVGKLGRFVETTSQWIERTLELRKALGKHLELGFGSTGTGSGGRSPVRTAADVRRSVLGWDGSEALGADPSAYFLARFYDELVAILVGLLQGNQQIRRAVRERLDPDRLVEAVSREAKLRLLVQATAGSALWKAYTQAYQELTDGGSYEAELEQLLQKALADRPTP
ncbi:MAG: FHA domain-containing protein [Planctomycetes bacterium]|nr:FHA domain-containing protein [Planctomycetota bacterium]